MMGTLSHSYGKPFGYQRLPRTCRWCGDKLRPGDVEGDPRLGYRGNGRFCTLRCGYQYAVMVTGPPVNLSDGSL
jgi:hypothetical protein